MVVERESLDQFLFKKVSCCKYDAISHVIKILLTTNHVQAYVECGFFQNADVLHKNIKELSIVSKRIVKDYLISNHLEPHCVAITLGMFKYCENAQQR